MPKILIKIHNPHSFKLDLAPIEQVAKRLWKNDAKTDAQITIILADDKFIRQLNKDFLKKDTVTDVIAFPLADCGGDSFFEGEIYISIDRVKENAASFETDFKEELNRMVIHGLLHFLGYDDKSGADKRKMAERENYYLETPKSFSDIS